MIIAVPMLLADDAGADDARLGGSSEQADWTLTSSSAAGLGTIRGYCFLLAVGCCWSTEYRYNRCVERGVQDIRVGCAANGGAGSCQLWCEGYQSAEKRRIQKRISMFPKSIK